MSLPVPNLDDRSFQDIVDDAKRQIGRRCPEWTDHNVSDPGVTLIELFASMTEMMLYRLNQVPEKNYLKFLEMIGISLEPPAPARTDLRFRLTRPIADEDGEEAFERTLRARETVAATVRTEFEPAIEFATEADLRMLRPRLAHILAIAAEEVGVPGNTDPAGGARQFHPGTEEPFTVYSPQPRDGDSLYFGFEADVSSQVVALNAQCLQSAATGLDEDYPAQLWEVWNGAEDRWDALEVTDTTFGFNRSVGESRQGESAGIIELTLPRHLVPRQIDGKKAYWVRCRYTPVLPPRGAEMYRPAPYQKSPEVLALDAEVIGGVVSAANCATVLFHDLGQSDGLPGQIFALGHAPVLPRFAGETVLVGEQGTPRTELTGWAEVADFSESEPGDRHYVCDAYKGEILFGPEIVQPDGSVFQHGAIPEKGLTITFSSYRHGGGTRGNVAAKQISILKSGIPYIAEVFNPRRAEGGREIETIARAKLRGQALLRRRERAVTVEDYEFLALRASSAVGRARCVQPRARHLAGANAEQISPGVVRVLLVPALGTAVAVPTLRDLALLPRVRDEVLAYLDQRRLLTAILEVAEPSYVFVSTDIRLVADPKADADQVIRDVRLCLEHFIHPITGGPGGEGWPFQRPLTLADIYAEIQKVPGVAFLRDAKVYASRPVDGASGLLTPEAVVSNAEGVRLGENELLCTREHRIRAIPIWAVGMDDTLPE